MTDEQIKARGQRYALWYDNDGLKDCIEGLKAEYIARIAKLDPTDSEFAARAKVLSIAAKVVDQVDAHIRATMGEGVVAARELEKVEKLSKLTKEQRRWL